MSNRKQNTTDKKQLFLDNYPTFITIKATAEAVGISKDIVQRWLNENDPRGSGDKQFFTAFSLIKKEVERELIEKHEKNIDNVAFEERTPAQSRIFGSLVRLRAIAPEKYREKTPETRLIGDITVKLAIPSYEDNPKLGEPKLLKEAESAKGTS